MNIIMYGMKSTGNASEAKIMFLKSMQRKEKH